MPVTLVDSLLRVRTSATPLPPFSLCFSFVLSWRLLLLPSRVTVERKQTGRGEAARGRRIDVCMHLLARLPLPVSGGSVVHDQVIVLGPLIYHSTHPPRFPTLFFFRRPVSRPDAFCASQAQNKCSNVISFVQDTSSPTTPSYQQGDRATTWSKAPGTARGSSPASRASAPRPGAFATRFSLLAKRQLNR